MRSQTSYIRYFEITESGLFPANINKKKKHVDFAKYKNSLVAAEQ